MAVEQEFVKESRNRLEASIQRLNHCLEQTGHAQLWWRPNEHMNSIGILVMHICGSFRQWAIVSIDKREDTRNRPDEFRNNECSKAQLLEMISRLKADFNNALDRLEASRLLESRRIQGYDVSLMAAIFRALVHLEGHVGQAMLLTRMQLGDDYKVFWVPQTEEQKAERKNNN
jgi:hypothetical protein